MLLLGEFIQVDDRKGAIGLLAHHPTRRAARLKRHYAILTHHQTILLAAKINLLEGTLILLRLIHQDLLRLFLRFRVLVDSRLLHRDRLRHGFRLRLLYLGLLDRLGGLLMMQHSIDEFTSLIDHSSTGPIDHINKAAIDKDTGQNPTAQERNHRTETTDCATQQIGHRITQRATGSRAGAETPRALPEAETERQRSEQGHQDHRKGYMVCPQRLLTNHPHTEQRQEHRQQYHKETKATIN